ncbi:MAG: glycosyltransferase family 4 protein [Acidimicrobiales bacterium]
MPRCRRPEKSLSPPGRRKIGDLAAESGLRRIHMLAWRDLADVEAAARRSMPPRSRRGAEAGIEVTMRTSYAQGSPPETSRDGYRVVRKAGRYLVFPRAVAAELAGRHGPRDGLVEIWNGVPFFSPLWARGPRVTWLHHVHEDMWPLVLPGRLARAGQLLERRLAPPFYRRTQMVTLSDSSKGHIVERLRLPADHVHVVEPGIDPRYSPGGSRAVDPTVLAVGRLMPSKAFEVLIEAVQRVREHVPARLVIIGEGYARDELEARVRDLDAEEWCELPGRVDDADLVDHYRRAWVVASASRSEGWGMTLTEAAACGTPAVATRIPGHVDAVTHDGSGLLVDTGDELVDALRRVLTDHALRDRLGAGALRRAAQLTWDRTAYDTLAVLAATASRRPRG